MFLRVLEYYSGILFLTTNRVGTLDEAFKSRIHLSLYYPPFSLSRTLAIFEVNLRKLRELEEEQADAPTNSDSDAPRTRLFIDDESILDYARWYFKSNKETPEQRWNGRQIRNAFQTAYSLARFDMEQTAIDEWDDERDNAEEPANTASRRTSASLPRLTLDYRQFEMVAHSIEKFESYLYHATGATDKDRAATRQTRADDFEHHRWEARNVYRTQTPPTRSYQQPKPYLAPEHRGGGDPSRRSDHRPPQQDTLSPRLLTQQRPPPRNHRLEGSGSSLRPVSSRSRTTSALYNPGKQPSPGSGWTAEGGGPARGRANSAVYHSSWSTSSPHMARGGYGDDEDKEDVEDEAAGRQQGRRYRRPPAAAAAATAQEEEEPESGEEGYFGHRTKYELARILVANLEREGGEEDENE